MKSHHTEPDLAKVIGIYLRGRGRRRFRVPGLPYRLWDVATAQDRIGWRHFTEGKVCKQLRSYQGKHLANRRTNLTIDSWLKGFVGKLLEMTHSQWIFRCISKHHHTNGALALKSREEVLARIEQQLDKGIEALPTEDQWLLEIDAYELRDMNLREQKYWLLAVEAARQAGENALKLSKGETSSWRDIMKNPLLSESLPTSTPLEEEDASVRAQETGDKGQTAGVQLAERSKNAREGEPAVGAPTQ